MTEIHNVNNLVTVGIFDRNLKPTLAMKKFEEVKESDIILKTGEEIFKWLAGEYMTIPYWKMKWGEL